MSRHQARPVPPAAVTYEFDVFIAYSRRNGRFVDRLVADLQSHQIRVWQDKLQIDVGESFRQKIEAGIQLSRHFCTILSPAFMDSFFARHLELEAAFTLMVKSGRQAFILPVVWRRTALPPMLASLHHLDFSSSRRYTENMSRLVRKIKLGDEQFTGERWYKNIDVSVYGTLVGLGELNHLSHSGTCVRIHFERGVPTSVDLFRDGQPDGRKILVHDSQGRLRENALERAGLVVDTWRYIYDQRTGRRTEKQVYRPGERPHHIILYDSHGNRSEERLIDQNGKLHDGPEGFARRRFRYDSKGNVISEIRYNSRGKVISRGREAR